MPKQHTPNMHTRRGFSLIELVIVVVIIGIIGAIAVPRMSRGAEGAAVSALRGDLAVLNKAVDLYAAEHNGNFPRTADVEEQLTGKTTDTGAAPSLAGQIVYGPYLRTMPPLPLGEKKGSTGIAASDGAGVGWIYKQAKGVIRPNLNKAGAIDETLVSLVINGSDLKRIDLIEP